MHAYQWLYIGAGCRWQVFYDDGNSEFVCSRDMVVCEEIPRNHAVLAKPADSQDYHTATINHSADQGYSYDVNFTDHPSIQTVM